MMSLASVPEGLLMLSDVALLRAPLLALTALRNPMIGGIGQVSATSQSGAAGRQTAPALPGGCWQLMLVPSQVSAVQGAPSARPAAPPVPARGWRGVVPPAPRAGGAGVVAAGA